MHISKKLILVIIVSSAVLAGCVNHYRFESRGSVEMSSGETKNAVMYWFGDEGRLWYGKKYKETDSGIEMRICNVTPKSFVPNVDTQALQLLTTKAGDLKVASVDQSGKLTVLDAPIRVPVKSPCGKILVEGGEAKMTDLTAGSQPDVAFLCKNVRVPDRYPNVRLYQFKAVTKTEIKKREAAIACP